jgi:hypothetical protein
MSKILINQTAASLSIDVGDTLVASGQLTINPQDYDEYAASDDIVELIGNGSIVINDGSKDLTKADGIRLIQGGFSNKIQLDEDLLDSQRIKVDVTGTLTDGTVKVSSNDSTTGFLQNKIISADTKINVDVINEGASEELRIQLVSANINTTDLNNNANFINATQAPVQIADIANFEETSELNARDTQNRNRANHTGTQTASTISDFTTAVQTAETDTTLSFNNTTKVLSYVNEAGSTTNVDLTQFLDDTNLALITSGTLDAVTGIATFTRDDATSFTVDFSSLNDQAAISTAIDTHELTIENHDDVVLSRAKITGDTLSWTGSVWDVKNEFKDFVVRNDGLINQTTTFQNYSTITSNIPQQGNYKISWAYTWSVNSQADDFEGRVQVNNSNTIFEHIQEPKDSAGTGITLPNTGGGNTNTGTDQIHNAAGFTIVSLNAGNNTIDLDFAGSTTNLEATIYQSCITIERF